VARPRRNIVITIPAEAWDRLVAAGKAEERNPWQHARWLVLRGLEDDHGEPGHTDETVEQPLTEGVA